MGIFDAFYTTEIDASINSFIPQRIKAKVNGTESIHACLYKIVSSVLGLDIKVLSPGIYLEADLGCDELDMFDIITKLEEHIVFGYKNNQFGHWARSFDISAQDITLEYLEKQINAGEPKFAARYKG